MLIAINRHIVNKASGEQLKSASGQFENLDVKPEELAALIDRGFAFCAQHHSGWRASKNFTVAGFLAVDIDHGLSVETVLNDPYFQQYGCLLYTTPSHKADAHRFRVLFELETPIAEGEQLRQALTGLIVKFGADGSCKDPCRMFFGSKNSAPVLIGKRLPATEVEALQARAEESRIRTASDGDATGGIRSAVRSRITIASDTTVRTASGLPSLLTNIPPHTSIFCPQHIDNHPSAFTLRNRHGVSGFACSACNATFFVDDGSGVQHSDYRFDYHWNSVLALNYEQYSNHMDDDGSVDMSTIVGGHVRQWSEARYLPYEEPAPKLIPQLAAAAPLPGVDMREMLVAYDFEARAGITLIKSPKGTGKTEWLKRLVEDAKAADLSVLLIGHRRALITATAERIGLTSYLAESEEGDEDAPAYRIPNRHYAVCVDSIDKLRTQFDRYDLVVIDEVEQVIAHLLSATLREHRQEALLRFQFYLKQAGAMYLLDADLNRVTIEVLEVLLDDNVDRTFQVLLNWWKPDNKIVHLYDGTKPDALIGELIGSLSRDERCFVCSNSKEFIDRLEGEVANRFGDRKVTLKITSENSQKPAIQSIVRDIRTRALQCDVIFTSPALGTGIDITFEGDAALIDTVYGFFQARINTHFDIDQQLARVRNPKRINVWVSPQEFQFETDSEAIKAELLSSGAEHRKLLRIESDGELVYDELYDTIYAAVTASQRASKNRLRQNFIELRRSNGWTVEHVAADTETARLGKEISKAGKEAIRRERAEQLLSAPQITVGCFDALKKAERAEKLKDADRPTMRRFEIEAFYRSDATAELLDADEEGRLRESIRNFEVLMADDEKLREKDFWQANSLTPDQGQWLLKKQLLQSIFELSGVFRDDTFDSGVEIESSQLDRFAREVVKRKVEIERHFGIQVRADTIRKPVQQLKALLALMGLTLSRRRVEQSNKAKRYFYGLDVDRLHTLLNWAAFRGDPHRYEAWRMSRGVAAASEQTGSVPGNPDDASDPLDRPLQARAQPSGK
ncbi:MAG: hypothetical protein EON54_01855 [Alcaligenaceae bacterium]|nr:MAG: hypothetical protein EON54_01855 [Alcaligenaceae bacterium]